MITREFHVITPLEFTSNTFDQKKINVLFTFDDGYQSWVDICLPVLNECQIKAIFFVNSGLLDAADSSESPAFFTERILISPKIPLTWEGARELVAQGHTLGGHTAHHVNLAACDRPTATTEIEADKKRLEAELGIQLGDFAYPFGTKHHFKNETKEVAQNAGYVKQYSAITGFTSSSQDLPIPRTLLEKDQPLYAVKSWVEGAYDIFNMLKL